MKVVKDRLTFLLSSLLLFLFLSSVYGNSVVFFEDFESGKLASSDAQWVLGPFLLATRGAVVPDPENSINKVITFNSTSFFSGGGDLFTKNVFTSPTGTFRVSFDFRGSDGCEAYVGWYFYPIPNDTIFEHYYGRHGWFGSSLSTYCEDSPASTRAMRLGSCDQAMAKLDITNSWIHYDLEPALVAMSYFDRNDTAIALGVGLMIEDVGNHPFSCYFDNITFIAVQPPTTPVSVSTSGSNVTFSLNSPSLLMKPTTTVGQAQEEAPQLQTDFVRVLEVSNNGTMIVNRYFPTTDYVIASDQDSITFANNLSVYGKRNSTFSVEFTLFSKETVVNNGAANFVAAKDTLEWAIDIHDWPFISQDNILLLEFGLSAFGGNLFTLRSGQTISTERNYRATLRLEENGKALLDLTIILPLVASVDGAVGDIPQPILISSAGFAQFLQSYSGSSDFYSALAHVAAEPGDEVDRIIFVFPSFTSTLNYDPNLGLLLGEKNGSSDDHTVLIVLTTVLISSALILVAVVVAAGIAWLMWRERKLTPEVDFVQIDPSPHEPDAL